MYSQFFNKREAEEILERIEKGEDVREICEKLFMNLMKTMKFLLN